MSRLLLCLEMDVEVFLLLKGLDMDAKLRVRVRALALTRRLLLSHVLLQREAVAFRDGEWRRQHHALASRIVDDGPPRRSSRRLLITFELGGVLEAELFVSGEIGCVTHEVLSDQTGGEQTVPTN